MVVRFDRAHLSPSESRRLGRNLSEARKAVGVSLGSLARRLKLPEATVGAYEVGRARFPVRLVFAAARALKVSPYQLLAGASDRVLNSWGPDVVEWNRLRSSKGRKMVGLPERERSEDGPVGEKAPKQAPPAPDRCWGGPMEVLKGEEVRRAIEFLDEAGPSGLFEAEGEEGW